MKLAYPLFAVFFAVAMALCLAAAQQEPEFSVLVFSKTAGFRHSSIPNGIAAIQKLGMTNGFAVTATEDPALFNDQHLGNYRAVVFLNTTGDVLDDAQQAAFERYIRGGGGFAGVHSASDTEYDWPFYGRLVGAYFKNHPAVQAADVRILDRLHPSTQDVPELWRRVDEWYNFRAALPTEAHVLAKLDETTYKGGEMGDHPVSWCQEVEGGRSWYTAMGHTEESYAEPAFLAHLAGGIRAAAGVAKPACVATSAPSPSDRRPDRTPRPKAGKAR